MDSLPVKWVPSNYQLTALSFILSNPRSGLFLDPGLGKTSISLACIKALAFTKGVNGVLIVAPLTVCQDTWPDEIEKWSNFNGITYTMLHGDGKPTLWGKRKHIYLINPEGLPWLFDTLVDQLSKGRKCPFNALWIDESTAFKSHKSKARFEILKDMLPLFKRRHIMTGTPSPKSLLDLWSQIYLLDEGAALGNNFYKFRRKHFEQNRWQAYEWKIKPESKQAIYDAIAPCVLEMAADDYLDMPAIVYNHVKVRLPAKVSKQYRSMEQKLFALLDEDEKITAMAAAQASAKCHQMANGQVYEDIPMGLDDEALRAWKRTRKVFQVHKGKITALENLISELNGKSLLIVYHYKHDLEAIQKALGGKVPVLSGKLGQKDLRSMARKWNARELPIMLGHADSIGYGLNLQKGGNDICWYSLPWDLKNYIQLNARLHRQGVTGAVRIHHLVSANTVDEAIVSRLGDRAAAQTDLRNALRDYRKKSNHTANSNSSI